MLLDRLIPSRCSAQSEALRTANRLHALSGLEVGAEARKTQARVGDLRVIADAAEKRSGLRAAEDALRRMQGRDREKPDA